MEIRLAIEPNDASRFGMKLLCSPGGEEETVVTYDARASSVRRRLREGQTRTTT